MFLSSSVRRCANRSCTLRQRQQISQAMDGVPGRECRFTLPFSHIADCAMRCRCGERDDEKKQQGAGSAVVLPSVKERQHALVRRCLLPRDSRAIVVHDTIDEARALALLHTNEGQSGAAQASSTSRTRGCSAWEVAEAGTGASE